GYGWHGEEIHGGNGFSVITRKRTPSLGGLWICWRSSHPTGNRPLGNIEPKHPEFAVDTRRAPGWVLDHHAKDQIPHLFGDSLPAYDSPSPGDQTPIESASRFVPSHNGFRARDNESRFPSGPEPSRHNPEELIEGNQLRPRMPLLEDCKWLAKSQVFKKKTSTRAEEANNGVK